MGDTITPGQHVLVLFEGGKTSIQRVGEDSIHTHRGFVKLDDSLEFGQVVTTNIGRKMVLLKPVLSDYLQVISRRTQILYPKELGYIVLSLGLRPGLRVLDAGTGSGASAALLANFIGPAGHVLSIDNNQESLDIAAHNLNAFGLDQIVELRLGDITEGVGETEAFDAAIMDLPSPWEAVRAYHDSLKSSARVAAIVPTYNQLEKVVEGFELGGFAVLETVDIMSQAIRVRKGAVRPLPFARSHNAFLVIAAKTVEKVKTEPPAGRP